MADFRGKFGKVYDEIARTGQTQFLDRYPPAVRRRLLIDAQKKQQAREMSFSLATSGTILDPSFLNVLDDGTVTAPHSRAQDYPEAGHIFVINDIQFSINPTQIQMANEAHLKKDWTMRSSGMTKTKSGRGSIFFSVTLPFVTAGLINTQMRRLIAQIRTIPIVYIDNALIRQMIFPDDNPNLKKNMAAVVTAANITTHPEATDVLVMTLSMEAFNYTPFSYDLLYMYAPAMVLFPSQPNTPAAPAAGAQPRTVAPTEDEMRRIVTVKTPDKSPAFVMYYDSILGDSEDISIPQLNVTTSSASTSPATPQTTGQNTAANPVSANQGVIAAKELLFDKKKRLYDFKRVGENLDSTLKFSYYVYKVLTPEDVSKLGIVAAAGQQINTNSLTPNVSQYGSYSVTSSAAQGIVNAPTGQTLGNLQGGSLTGGRVPQENIIKLAESYLGTPYKFAAPRLDLHQFDCSSFVYNMVRLAGVGDIGSSTIGQVQTLDHLSNMGARAYLRIGLDANTSAGSILIPLPLEIKTISTNPQLPDSYKIEQSKINVQWIRRYKVMGIPGIVGHFWQMSDRDSNRNNPVKVFRPTHATLGHSMENGRVKTIEAVRAGVSYRYNRPQHSAYFVPNTVYNYNANEEQFNAILSLPQFNEARAAVIRYKALSPQQKQTAAQDTQNAIYKKIQSYEQQIRNIDLTKHFAVADLEKQSFLKQYFPDNKNFHTNRLSLNQSLELLSKFPNKDVLLLFTLNGHSPKQINPTDNVYQTMKPLEELIVLIKQWVAGVQIPVTQTNMTTQGYNPANPAQGAGQNLPTHYAFNTLVNNNRADFQTSMTSDQIALEEHYRNLMIGDKFREQILVQARLAQEALTRWIQHVQAYLKKVKGSGWELVWMKDGTAIFRRLVTLTISPGVAHIYPSIRPNYGSAANITVSLQQMIARLPLIGQFYATHQFMGSGDAEAYISFQMVGNGMIGALQYMQRYNEHVARLLRRLPDAGIISVQNDVLNLTGGDKYIIENIEVSTFEPSPDTYMVKLKLSEWKKHQEEEAQLQLNFYTELDTKKKFINKLGELLVQNNSVEFVKMTSDDPYFYRRNMAEDVINVVEIIQGISQKKTFIRMDFKLLKHYSLSFKDIDPDSSVVRLSNGKVLTLNRLQGAYLLFASILESYWKEIANTEIFSLLGWTKDSFIAATKNPEHPLYSYGMFNILLEDPKGVQFYAPKDVTRSAFLYARFRSRLIEMLNLSEKGLKSQVPDPIRMTSDPYYNELFSDLRVSAINYFDTSYRKEREAHLENIAQTNAENQAKRNQIQSIVQKLIANARGDADAATAIADAEIAHKAFLTITTGNRLTKFLSNFGPGSTFVAERPTLGIISWLGSWLQSAPNYNLANWFLSEYRDKPEIKVLQLGKGPNAGKVMQSIPANRVILPTAIQVQPSSPTNPQYQITQSIAVSAQQEIEFQQYVASAALIMFFARLRRDIESHANTILRHLMMMPEFRGLAGHTGADGVLLRGQPAYRDIPLPLVPIVQIEDMTSNPAPSANRESHRYLNPDFYWYNADDYQLLNMEFVVRQSQRGVANYIASQDFANQFGMMPLSKENVDRANQGLGRSGKITVTENKTSVDRINRTGTPGIYAYLGDLYSSHKQQLGTQGTTAGLANNLPDSLFLSLMHQELTHLREKPKSANNKINIGVSDSGIANSSPLNVWQLSSEGGDVQMSELALRQEKHPFNDFYSMNLTNVTFGAKGTSELRVPVLLDRRPENLLQQFAKALTSYQRNLFKMRRAFPAFKLYFIEDDTSGIFGTDPSSMMRSFDDFFSYNAIKEIKLVQSRKIPADLLIIRLSNVLGYLDALEFSNDVYDVTAPISSDTARQNATPLMQDTEHENPFTRFVLKEGVRVQYRAGYENDPANLETMFNGQIVQINAVDGDEIAIVCQTFATQLVAYRKGTETESVPTEWVDTFDLLSWAICQPEVTYFGRWLLDNQLSVGESRSTGGWEKIFTFLADPRDDNFFAPSRHEVISLAIDTQGGLWSYLSSFAYGISKTYRSDRNKVTFLKSAGDIDVFRIDISDVPVLDPSTGGIRKSSETNQGSRSTIGIREAGTKTVAYYGTFGRGNSSLLDYHVNKTTIWDIFKEMELRHPGWIAAPTVYGNRMTMFFGQPTQLYWSRPPTTLELTNIAQFNADMNNSIFADRELSDIYRQVLAAKHSTREKLARLPVIGWAIRNPIAAMSYALLLGAGFKLLLVGKAAMAAAGGLRATASLAMTGLKSLTWKKAIQGVANTRIAQVYFSTAMSTKAKIGTGALAIAKGVKWAAIGGSTTAMKAISVATTAGAVAPLTYQLVGMTGLLWNDGKLIYNQAILAQAQHQYMMRALRDSMSGRLIPYRRYHFLTADHHIISNQIKSSIHGIYNAISLEYTRDSGLVGRVIAGKTETKTMKGSARILDKDIRMGHFSYPNCRGRWMADRYMQGLLLLHMKDMYKGQIYIIGDSRIRPYDRCYISDSYSDMFGFIDVEQAIHTWSPSTGYITEITPDMVIYGNNIVDMPFDDYISAKMAWSNISWAESVEALVRMDGSAKYQEELLKQGGLQEGQPSTSAVDARAMESQLSEAVFNQKFSWFQLLGHTVAGGLLFSNPAGWVAASAIGGASYFLRMRNSHLGFLNNVAPFYATSAVKFYEWTTQRQPLIFQPLFLGGRPLIAGVDMDKVNMVQHFKDQYIPIRRNIDLGLQRLQNLGTSIITQNAQRIIQGLPAQGSGRNPWGME